MVMLVAMKEECNSNTFETTSKELGLFRYTLGETLERVQDILTDIGFASFFVDIMLNGKGISKCENNTLSAS